MVLKIALTTCVLLAMACLSGGSPAPARPDPVTAGTELVMSFLIHRHGDRTPIESVLSLLSSSDVQELEELIAPWGYGQLTNVGRRRGYELGQYIRRRYDELISDTYNKSKIYIRSTDSTRTKMTVLTAMSAVYPAVGDTWSQDINWVPVPYATVPARYDFNLGNLNCPVFVSEYTTSMLKTSTAMDEYADVIARVSEILNYDITAYPILSYAIYDLFVSQKYLGYELGQEVEDIMPELAAAAGEAMEIIFGDNSNIDLLAGVLLNEFFTYANTAIAGTDTQRLRIYSAHDINVFALYAITQATPSIGVPFYASAFSLELRKVVRTGKYVVLPVYFNPLVGEEVYLEIEGCGSRLCDIDTFYSLTSQYLLDETSWRTKCEYSDDYEIDTSAID